MPVGRFAPSPTGDLHLGNLRTALLAWMWSRRDGNPVLLRMEDLDRVTSSRAHERSQEHDLAAIGLDWDGAVVRQSERFDLYDDAIAELLAADRAFACFCTRREIAEAASAPNQPATGRYPGTCRALSAHRRQELERAGRPPALRLRADDAVVSFDDAVMGEIAGVPDDVVLRRNDGVPAYNLAVVVDDAVQGIEIVVRGDDLAPSTPSQVHLQRSLGLPTPEYAHVPLVLAPDGRRLAKRDGSVTLADRVALGDSPADVTRWLLHSCGIDADADSDEPSQITATAAAAFDPRPLPRDPVVLSEEVLTRSLRSPR